MLYEITIFCFVLNLLVGGCSVAQEAPSRNVVTVEVAQEIVRSYLNREQRQWGRPTEIRTINDKYIFMFYTPDKELRSLGQRILYVNRFTGEVSFPLRF